MEYVWFEGFGLNVLLYGRTFFLAFTGSFDEPERIFPEGGGR